MTWKGDSKILIILVFRILKISKNKNFLPTSKFIIYIKGRIFKKFSKIYFKIFLDVPQPVHSARISSCNIDEPIVTIDFEHYEPADRSKPVEEFWYKFLAILIVFLIYLKD